MAKVVTEMVKGYVSSGTMLIEPLGAFTRYTSAALKLSPPVVTTYAIDTFVETTSSVNSPPLSIALRTERVLLKPKKPLKMIRPVRPVIRKPKLLKLLTLGDFRPRAKSAKESQSSYDRFIAKRKLNYDAYALRVKRYNGSIRQLNTDREIRTRWKNEELLARFNKRTAIYNEALRRRVEGTAVYVVRKGKKVFDQWNNYSRTRVWQTGFRSSGYGDFTRKGVGVGGGKFETHPVMVVPSGNTLSSTLPSKVVAQEPVYLSSDVMFSNVIYRSGVQYTGGPYGTSSPDVNKIKSIADKKAILKLRNKLNDQEVHFGNVLAERHQAYALLKDTVSGLIALATSHRKVLASLASTVSDKRLLSRAVADRTLQYKFGAEPMIKDIYALASGLKNTGSKADEKIVVRARQSHRDVNRVETFGSAVVDCLETRVIVTVSYVLEYRVSNGTLSSLQQLGLVNPYEIAWEAMPWSFVIDWVYPLGSWIRSFTADAGLTFVRGTKTVTTTTTATTRRVFRWDQNTASVSYGGDIVGTKVTEQKDRTVLLTAPVLTILPLLKNPFSMWHLAESISLIRQKLKL